MFPKIIKVAVPSPQHSPMLGQLPLVQIVFNLYLSTKPLSSVYFLPTGNFTRNHSGFFTRLGSTAVSFAIFVIIYDAKLRRKLL